MYADAHSMDMRIRKAPKAMGVVPEIPQRRETFGIRRSECYVSLLAVQASGTSPVDLQYRGFAPQPFASPVLMILARVPPTT
jgi:hypothetical protein